MISIITYGRNDNYSYNLVKRTALSFNCLAEALTDEDEILFADCNTPDHLPTLPEFIWDTLSDKALKLIKVVRIPPALYEKIRDESPLPVLENVSRNAAIVRSNPRNHWMLSTNPDVLLVLAAKWPSLAELLRSLPDSFYEMPRFDIPESVWSSLARANAQENMRSLRDWLIANKAAVIETLPDHRFQKFYLFDAPGDFQLAPRAYFHRLRGFDESMKKYFHSDANLAKRMWLLNGRRTDHLLGELWVLHQDHYLSGEWTKTVTTIEHNDYYKKVINEEILEANHPHWGLQDVSLPFFSLSEQILRQRVFLPQVPPALDGDLPLSREPDWTLQPFYRLVHYDPALLTLYLKELLRVISPESRIAYLGRNTETLDAIQRAWRETAADGHPVLNLAEQSDPGEYASPDVLLVDCYYQRSEYWERRIQLLGDQLKHQAAKGRISADEANEELSRFCFTTDWENQREQLVPLWERYLKSLSFRPGAHVVLLGCNVYVPTLERFQEVLGELSGGIEIVEEGPARLRDLHAFYQKVKYRLQKTGQHSVLVKVLWTLFLLKRRLFRSVFGFESFMGWLYFRQLARRRRFIIARLNLRTLYTHHRLVVMRVEAPTQELVEKKLVRGKRR